LTLGSSVRRLGKKLVAITEPEYIEREGFRWYNQGIADPTPEMFALESTFKQKDVEKGGHIFVDIGANMGLWTVQASRHFDYVYAFEPNPEIYQVLLKNIEINHVKNLTVENIAIGSFDGEVTLHRYYNHAWSSILREHNGREALGTTWQVQCKKLDSILLNYITPTVLKIDTEGYELNVLKGAERILRMNHPKLLMEIHAWNDYKEITDYLSDFDYKIRQPEPLHLVGE